MIHGGVIIVAVVFVFAIVLFALEGGVRVDHPVLLLQIFDVNLQTKNLFLKVFLLHPGCNALRTRFVYYSFSALRTFALAPRTDLVSLPLVSC